MCVSTTTLKDTKLTLPKISEHQMAEQNQGSDDRVELDIKSEVNPPALGKLRQCTTVSSHCVRFF